MLPLGHVFVAVGGVYGAERLYRGHRRNAWITDFLDAIDYRFVAIGAILPDLIDKPIIWLTYTDPTSTGQHFAHSLFFVLGLVLAGVAVFATARDGKLASLGLGALLHVLTDAITHVPRSIFRPFLTVNVDSFDAIHWGVGLSAELLGAVALGWAL